MINRRWLFGLLLCSAAALSEGKETLRCSEVLSIPPVFQQYFGDPRIRVWSASQKDSVRVVGVGSYHPLRSFGDPPNACSVVIRSTRDLSRGEIATRASHALLDRFYDDIVSLESRSWHDRRFNLAELFPISPAQFRSHGAKWLQGGRSGVAWFDAWWIVRMGLPQTHDPGNHITLTLLQYDHDGEKDTLGHLCFGLRQRGGNEETDLQLDFRAPWYVDRQPRKTEGLNIHKVLILEGYALNLYDWLYTQTEYRQCYVSLWFLPTSREQVTILRHFEREVGVHDAGYFRAFRKNCASLALAYLHRLGPFSEPSPLGKGLADIPVKKVDSVLEKYGDVPYYRLENVTDERGREPTAKSRIYRAQPTRGSSRAFRLLRTIPEVN